VALAARFTSLAQVVMGTTVGMLLANAPVVFFGEALARRMPVRAVHVVTAVIFAAMGIGVLVLG
jgi:putative Ca2+/H+ antiporter (TMEM165/GDT1 family)